MQNQFFTAIFGNTTYVGTSHYGGQVAQTAAAGAANLKVLTPYSKLGVVGNGLESGYRSGVDCESAIVCRSAKCLKEKELLIPVNPKELAQAIVGNNPGSVKANLISLGLIDQSHQLSVESFMGLLMKLPQEVVQTKAQAAEFIAKALDIQIDNNGFGAAYLWSLLNEYKLSLKDLVYQVFESHMPEQGEKVTPQEKKTCGCGGCKKQYNIQRNIILGLAFLGLIFLIILIVKLILKVIN